MFFIVIGLELATSVAVGLLIGSYFDEKFGNKNPYFTLLGLLAGVLAGFTLLIKLLGIKNKNDE